jgi:hypothetical protein
VPGRRGWILGFESLSSHDDSIFIDNSRRVADYVIHEGAMVKVWEKTEHWNLDLEYHPSALLYESTTNLDSLDQDLRFDGSVRASPHLGLRWSDTFTRVTGMAQPVSNQDTLLPAGPVPQLNTTLLAPLTGELRNRSALDVIYMFSRRASIDLSGSYEFADPIAPGVAASELSSERSATGGLSYNYRQTRHVTVGVRYFFQRSHFRAGSQDDTHSGYLTASWQMGPHAVLDLFGGVQYSLTYGLFLIPGPPGSTNAFFAADSDRWDPAGGASLTLRSDRTVLRLTGQRLVSDRGLLTSVVNWYGGAELRRRVVHGWDAVLTGTESRSVALQGPFGIGAVNMQSAGLALEHPLFANLSLHAEYSYFRERTNQDIPFTANVDRNLFTLGVFYRTSHHKQ